MDTHQTPNKNPSNFLETLPKEIRDAVNKKNQMPGSPFTSLPHHTTPPSRYFVTKNPFEVVMNDHLHKHIWSPSVFQEGKTPINSEKFKWNIEEISSLNPANIDVSSTTQFEHVQANTEDDVQVQAKIERYFRETQIAPSPWNEDVKHAPLLPEEGSPDVPPSVEEEEEAEEEPRKETCNVWSQTELSLPPNLPKELENALRPFFTFTEDQRRQSVDLDSSLRRRLFHFESPASDVEYISDHERLSEVGSPVMDIHNPNCNNRTFGSSPINDLIPDDLSPIHNSTPQKLNNCPISPISNVNLEHEQMREDAQTEEETSAVELPSLRSRRSFGSFAKADFSGHMSVDNSFNLAPENDRVDVGNDTNLSESPVRSNEFMESCNWDLEYNNISLNGRPVIRRTLFEKRRTCNSEHMDISNSHTTPKSKIINSQRKKLSDSFKLNIGEGVGVGDDNDNDNDDNDDEQIINFDYDEETDGQLRKRFCDKYDEADNFTLSQNTQDTGYNTCPESSHIRLLNYSKDEDMLVSDIYEQQQQQQQQQRNAANIFASTPSKGYFSKLKE